MIGCCVSESAMITECWTPQSNHRDTFFFIHVYHVILYILYMYVYTSEFLINLNHGPNWLNNG